MKIYTKTGDSGTTGVFAGQRVAKDDTRINAYGTVDELNAFLGVIHAGLLMATSDFSVSDLSLASIVQQIQSDLFCIGAELATPDPDQHKMRMLSQKRIENLEETIDVVDAELPKLSNFVLPGGSLLAAQLHFARTVCRRAEREVVSLAKLENVADYSLCLIYLNRLADLLFVLARLVNSRLGLSEAIWHRPQ
jgi:cob(I)alamin adenosyltransferase